MSGGVPLDQLHCPTCGGGFRNLVEFERNEEEELQIELVNQGYTIYTATNRPFLRCEHGHKWTIKTIWRAENRWDDVLLGDYLGT
jgi:hypothetical protein